MITVTRLDGSRFVLNAELIRTVESTPDTLIKLTTGDTYMVRDQANDPLAVRGEQSHARITYAFAEPIEPQAAVWIEHHFDDGRIVEPGCDGRPERCAQHARTA